MKTTITKIKTIWRKATKEEIEQGLDSKDNPGMIIESEEPYEVEVEEENLENNN